MVYESPVLLLCTVLLGWLRNGKKSLRRRLSLVIPALFFLASEHKDAFYLVDCFDS